MCEEGRPKSSTVRGWSPTAIDSFLSFAHPSWEDHQPLSLKCKMCVVDRPVMTVFSSFQCCMCAVKMLRHKHPGRGGNHSAPPISGEAVVNKVVGSLLLYCSTALLLYCSTALLLFLWGCKLQKMDKQLQSNCSLPLPSSPSAT